MQNPISRLCCLLCGLLLPAWACERQVPLKSGSEIFSVAPDAVLHVRLESEDRRAEAHRFTQEDGFTYIFERKGNHFDRCASSPARDSALSKFFSIRITGAMDEARAEEELGPLPTSGWTDLQVRGSAAPDTWFDVRLYPHPKLVNTLYTQIPGDSRTLTIDATPFGFLKMTCGGQ